MIDLKKKIKKVPVFKQKVKLEFIEQDEYDLMGHINGIPCYREECLGFDSELKRELVEQRVDNDVDTDDEQIQIGISKLRMALEL